MSKKSKKLISMIGAFATVTSPILLSAACSSKNSGNEVTKTPNLDALKKEYKKLVSEDILKDLGESDEKDPAKLEKGKRFAPAKLIQAYKSALEKADKETDEAKANDVLKELQSSYKALKEAIIVGTNETVKTPNLDALKKTIIDIKNDLATIEINETTDTNSVKKGIRFASNANIEKINTEVVTAEKINDEKDALQGKTKLDQAYEEFKKTILVGTNNIDDEVMNFKSQYTGDTKKYADSVDLKLVTFTDANGGDISTNGFEVTSKEFKNNSPSDDELTQGIRTVVASFTKNGVTSSKYEFDIQIAKTHIETIYNQLREIKNGTLFIEPIDSIDSKHWVTNNPNGLLYYDFKDSTFYTSENAADRIAVFRFNERLAYKKGTYATGIYNPVDKKSNVVKFIKEDEQYGIEFILGLFHKEEKDRLYHYETTKLFTSEPFQSIGTDELEKETTRIENEFKYTDADKTQVNNADKAGIVAPKLTIKDAMLHYDITKIDHKNGEITISYYLTLDGKKTSLKTTTKEVKISGFIKDALFEKFDGVVAKYADANKVKPSQCDKEKITFEKASATYTFDGAKITKEILGADDITGTLKIKVTIEVNGQTSWKLFDIHGFMVVAFSLDDFIANAKISVEDTDMANTIPSDIKTANIKLIGSGIDKLSSYEIKSIKANNKTGILEVTYKLQYNSELKEHVFKLENFKKDDSNIQNLIAPDLYEKSLNGTIFTINNKAKLKEALSGAKNKWIKVSSKGKQMVQIDKTNITTLIKFDDHFITNGSKGVTAAPGVRTYTKYNKGVDFEEISAGIYKLSWRLLLNGNTVYSQVFTQIIDLNN
ncbi:lipoprotein 17-related variable surface protein [Mycoplasmopsis primatum]|uniref:lipoprotein 17-related variable surface protein n=1 Tax=Mycoplasmopsis primatum TaxID=55604 RepID=UPI0004980A87|nr:lipoprotein 17-related variable surface protein [Mycoplasmopsis primatum]